MRTEKESHSLNRESDRKVVGIYGLHLGLHMDSMMVFYGLIVFLELCLFNALINELKQLIYLQKR